MPIKIDMKGHHAPLPTRTQFSDEDIFQGREDSQWVELDGVVRDNKFDSGQYSCFIAHNGYRFRALFPYTHPLPAELINAKVRVRGVCGAVFNSIGSCWGYKFSHKVLIR